MMGKEKTFYCKYDDNYKLEVEMDLSDKQVVLSIIGAQREDVYLGLKDAKKLKKHLKKVIKELEKQQ